MAHINEVYEWEGDTSQPFSTNFTWKGKNFLLPVRSTFGAAQVIAEQGDRSTYWALVLERRRVIQSNNTKIATGKIGGSIGENELAYSVSVNGDDLETVPTEPSYSGDFVLTLKVYADGTLKMTKSIYSGDPFRLLDGFRAREWELQLEGNVTVKRLAMAGSIEELKQLDLSGED